MWVSYLRYARPLRQVRHGQPPRLDALSLQRPLLEEAEHSADL